ncbi:histidine kinase [Tumidithrix helvetica PCC 7403]|uniref:PAS domain S-box protein n=1 Tax=Tumidithrix helvetica TaxID=3457545 RepID=UPI003CAE4352
MTQLLQPPTILIVDDSESDRATYSRYLQADQAQQYRILEAETFEEGLEMWRSQHPDLVMLDLNLPDGDGLEFLEAIDADRAGERVPTIVLTGQGTEKKAVSAMKLGAADYLVKGDITAKSFATAVRQVLRETALRRQLLRSQQQQTVIAEMALRIREFLNLEDISNAIVKEVRQFIHADRAAIYQFNPDMSGTIVAEDIVSPWQPCLNVQVEDTCFRENLGGAYCEGRVFVANDIYAANLTDCHIQLLERFQVRANLVVPILLSNEDKRSLWGLLIVHQCSAPRVWEEADIQLLQQLSVHLAIAIQQAIVYQQIQTELAERKRVEALLINQQAELEERNGLLERVSESLQCTVEELRVSTEEQILQHRLLEYEQSRYQNLFEFAPDGYLVTDLSGRILEANQAILKLLAISHEFIVGKPLVVFIDPNHRDVFYSHLNQISSLDNTTTTWEITLKARQGIPFPAEITVTQNINLANNETQLFWMIRDISNRKQTEQELLQLNQSLEEKVTERTQAIQLQSQMLEQIHDAIISTTMEGTIQTWNIGAESLYEYKPNEAIGQNVSMLYLNEDLSLIESTVFRPLLEKGTHKAELRNQTKSGKTIYVSLRLSLVLDELGKPIRMIGCSNNISDRKLAEESLRESEQRFANLAEAAPVAIFQINQNNECTYVNEFWSQITGQEPSTALGYGWLQTIHPDDREQIHQQWTQAIEQQAYYQGEGRCIKPDGTICYYYCQAAPELDEGGVFTGYIGTLTDISDRKQTELTLQKQALVFENISDGVIITDTNGIIIDWNQGAEELYGYSKAEVLGQPVAIIHKQEEGMRIANEVVGQTIENGSWSGELSIVHKEGITRITETTTVLLRDKNEQIIALIGVNHDISDRKVVEKALKQQLAAIEAAIDGIAILQDNNYIYVNQAHLEIFGYKHPDDLLCKSWTALYSSEEMTRFEQEVFPVLMRDRSWRGEVRAIRKDGSTFDEGLSLTMTEDGLLICVCRDISDRKQAEAQLLQANEELLRATRLKDEFLANMSHELRTPLNSILGLSEALKEQIFGKLNEKQVRAIGTVESSGEHLLSLINDILDLSKISSGMMEIFIESVSVQTLCDSSLVFIKQQAFQKRVQVVSNIPRNISNINVEERRIRQVLINLLTNAVKFTPSEGEISLLVSVGSGDTWQGEAIIPQHIKLMNSPSIVFQVADTGIGIASKDLQRLFQPFVQVSSSLNRQYEGTGLGLALVKQIVELHGGQVTVESEVGKGSRFTVVLPYETSESNTPESEATATSLPTIANHDSAIAPLILLAEDNEANIQTFSSYLNALDYRVIVARNGEEAIAMAKANAPDIILMDIQMPRMDGLEAIRLIRADTQIPTIPIIALTALAMEGDRERCLAAGANEYLAKPIKLKLLNAAIQKFLVLR